MCVLGGDILALDLLSRVDVAQGHSRLDLQRPGNDAGNENEDGAYW